MERLTQTFYKTYFKSGNIDLMRGTNSISIINIGTTLATINQMFPLQAKVAPSPIGGQLVDEGNENEINQTAYRVDFETGAGAILVAWKIYKDLM
jgi:hypothetical protein